MQYRVLAANAIDLVWAAICSETAAECGTDDGCLVSAPNVVMGDDFCGLPNEFDEAEDDERPVRVALSMDDARSGLGQT